MATAEERLRLMAQKYLQSEEEQRKRKYGEALSHSIEPRDIRRADEPVPPEPLPEEFGWVEDMDTSADVDPVPSVPEDALTDLGKEVRGEMRPPEKVKGSREVGEASMIDELEQSDIEMEALDRQATADKELDEYNAGEPARTEENAAEQKTHEERLSGALAKAEETRSDAPLMEGGIAASVIERDAPHVKELERREERLRQLGSGMSQGDIAAANNPMLQQAIADKAAREAAKPSVEERVARGSKQAQDKDRALEKAGYTVNRKFTPTFINPDTGKEEGGDPYDPSLREYIPITDEEGEVTGQILHEIPGARDKRRVSEEAQGKVRMKFGEEVAADDPSSANDTFVSRTQADKQVAARERRIREAAEQKDERKRRGMLLRGDTHALGELDRQTAEDAATRLRDAEAAIRAREDLTANEQAIAIQELKNAGATGVAQIGADAQTDVATTQAGADMHASDAGVEIAAGQNQSAETINAATLAAQAASQESQQEFNLELTSLNNQQQTDFQAAEHAHASSEAGMDRDQQALLLTMTQDFQAGESNLNREQETRLEELRQLHAIEGTTLNHQQQRELLKLTHAATASESAAARAGNLDIIDASRDDEAAQRAREDRELSRLMMARDSGTLSQAEMVETENRIREITLGQSESNDTSPTPEGDTSPTPEGDTVTAVDNENMLSRNYPDVLNVLDDLTSTYTADDDGTPYAADGSRNAMQGGWIGDDLVAGASAVFGGEVRRNNLDNLKYFAAHLDAQIQGGAIPEAALPQVGSVLQSPKYMDPAVLKTYKQLEREILKKRASPSYDPDAQMKDLELTYEYLKAIFSGQRPATKPPAPFGS